ncbi:conserved unknown protein [Ectocarpus siliculosus]|uniref:Calmodulin n=1 Tax=Ectocarpus siliculosus TaxID=2880 RepID=D7G477_ECTSI|nr:conserved unknown protein [Ectocarpus siliculosus]|eukprot:CBJ27092.1 conserved unknown protein [Ectocarpus siliculosus]
MAVTDNIQPQDSPVDEHRYAKIFEKLDTEDGYLSGKRAVVLLRKSGVPQETLSKVWALADSDVDGRLSLKEFCTAMHLIGCFRKGLPLPEVPSRKPKKPKKRQSPGGDTKPREGQGKREITFAKSPKRRSRLASLVDPHQDANPPGASIAKSHEPLLPLSRIRKSATLWILTLCGSRSPMITSQWKSRRLKELRQHRKEAEESRDHGGQSRIRRPNLRQLDDKDVDAVFAEGPGAINSLRDVQSWRVLVMGLQRLSGKDMARHVPTNVRPRRRHTLPLAAKGDLARKQDYLPGRGRRTSLLGTAYEPAALFLKQRAERRSIREADLEKDTAKAAEKWNLKPLREKSERCESDGEQTSSRGNLSVAGLPLLDEDVDIIVHLLRQNHAFKRLDLSRCFLSEKQFVSLAQALAWNSRIEELFLQECVFTSVGTAALADVLTVNNHIHSLDVRGCKGLDEKSIKVILGGARSKGNLLTFNGMNLADLRAEGSDELDLSG